jgi:hypothetical protein
MSALTDQIQTDVSDCFLSSSDWGVAASYTPSGGITTSVVVLFESAFEVTTELDGMEVRSTQPAAFCKVSDITSDLDGGILLIDSVTYYILSKQGEAADGMVLLLLSTKPIHG